MKVMPSALSIVAALASIWMLQFAQPLLVPIVLAVLISYVLEPAVLKLQKLKIPRAIGAAVILLIVVAGLSYGGYLLRDDVVAILDDLPDAVQKLRQTFDSPHDEKNVVEKVQEAATAIEKTAVEANVAVTAPRGVTRVQVEQKPLDLSGVLVWGSVGILSWVGSLVLLVFLTYFLLLSGNLFRQKLVKIAGPTLEKRKITIEILNEINRQIGRYVLVQVFTGTVVAVVSFIAFRFIGLERPAVWAVASGVLNGIPYFGPLLVTSGLAVVAFLQFGTLDMVVYVALIAVTITTLEGFLLTPYLVGRSGRMNGVAVFVGLLFWTWLWNIWGMLLAVPMLVIAKSICDRVEPLKPIGELLGD
jgi:predicted PurR-regulated permease PerM